VNLRDCFAAVKKSRLQENEKKILEEKRFQTTQMQ